MLTVVERVLLLQDMDILDSARTEDLAKFAAICREIEVPAGTILFREGESSRTLHLLIRGRVSLEANSGETTVVERGGVDIWSFFADTEQQYTAQALEECLFLMVSFEEMEDLLTAEPELCWAITRRLALIVTRSQ